MQIVLVPKKVFQYLLIIVLTLLLLNVLGIVSKYYFGYGTVKGLVPMFNFNTEKNVPTFYSTIALFISAVLLWLIAISHKRRGNSYLLWGGLAFIFLFLSIDEFVSIHEKLIKPLRASLGTSGVFSYAWVIPYGIAVVILFIVYLKFLFQLPRKIMYLFILSGSLFVMGAIGFEMISALQFQTVGSNNVLYGVYYTFEELLEMLGVVIFIYTLLLYIVSELDFLSLTAMDAENTSVTAMENVSAVD